MSYDKLTDIVLYLEDINSYVSSILYYHSCNNREKKKLYLDEILMYLESVPEIIKDIEDCLYNLYYSKTSDEL